MFTKYQLNTSASSYDTDTFASPEKVSFNLESIRFQPRVDTESQEFTTKKFVTLVLKLAII